MPGERKFSIARLKGPALSVLLAGSLASSSMLLIEYQEEHQRAEHASAQVAGLSDLLKEKSRSADHNLDLLRACMSELRAQGRAGEDLLMAQGRLLGEQSKLLEDKIKLTAENSALNRRIGGLLKGQSEAIAGRIECLEQLGKERAEFDAFFEKKYSRTATAGPARTSSCCADFEVPL